MAQILETMMLVCFGLSWPFNIAKSYRSRTAKGKSLLFEVCIIVGYLCGVGKSFLTFIHNTLSIFLVRLPVAYLMNLLFPHTLLPMGMASPLGSLFSILFLFGYIYVNRKRHPEDALL